MIHSSKRIRANLKPRLKIIWRPAALFIMLTVCGVLALNQVGQATERRLVQIYVDGESHTISTNQASVKDALKEADIDLGPLDRVEPKLNAPIEGDTFSVNVYRSSPFMVVDGNKQFVINSPYNSPLLVAKSAGLDVYPEDKITVELADDFVADQFIGKKLIIDRATPIVMEIDGHVFPVRTHAETVRDVLKETGIELIGEDFTTVSLDTRLTSDLHIGVVRVGHNVVTEEEMLPFATKFVADHELSLGQRKVIQEGVPGRKLYTYEIKLHNGVEVERHLISASGFSSPVPQIIARGTAIPDIYTNNDQIISALRECETHSNYQANTGNGYYGAYQFMDSTWDTLNTGYSRADLAPPEVQDVAVIRNARRSSGGFWSQHPGCSKYLHLPQFPFDN